MKYDLVISNFPFQSPNERGVEKVVPHVGVDTGAHINQAPPAWPKFIKWSMEVLNDGGTLACITPATWMERRQQASAWKTISQYDLQKVTTNVHEYFRKVDVPTGISVMTVVKQPYSGNTCINDDINLNFHKDPIPGNTKVMTVDNMKVWEGLIKKKLNLEVFSGPSQPSINSNQYSEKKTRIHQYETYYSGHELRRSIWCDEPIGHYGEWKLVVASSGAYWNSLEITDKGVGRQGNYVLGTKKELKRIQKLLLSDDSRQLGEMMMSARYNNALENVCDEV